MSASTPEGKVKAKIDAILKPYKVSGRLWYTKTAGSMFGKNGVPDYICCLYSKKQPGLFFSIEAKTYNEHPTELQAAQMRGIAKAGGITFVIHPDTVDQIEEFLRAHS